MDVDRRTLVKGALACGALSALGARAYGSVGPRRPTTRECALLLAADPPVNAAFERGALAARGSAALDVVRRPGGVLRDLGGLAALLERSRGTRWIAVMDDASAAVFQGLARNVGVRLLSRGSHACSDGETCSLRHVWSVTSPTQSAAERLAVQLGGVHGTVSIEETFLERPSHDDAPGSCAAPGFSSYRSAGTEAIHMHCSGVSPVEAGRLIGLPTHRWTPIPSTLRDPSAPARRSEDWVKAVGHAVMASALGAPTARESCSRRAFVHRTRARGAGRPMQRFVSFVMDL